MKCRYFILFLLLPSCRAAAQHQLTVNVDSITTKISPTMWGVFFEDINFAADGGLYAELVKNRSFEFPMPLMGWKLNKTNYQKGDLLIINNAEKNGNNTRFARITIHTPEGIFSLANEGFRGIGVQKERQYNFSILARAPQPNNLRIIVQLINSSGKIIGTQNIEHISGDWKKYQASLITTDSSQKGKLNLIIGGRGSLDIDMVSLFPEDTWKKRPGGLRNDLVQKIADLKPGFIRFPGGCIVEGRELTNRYQWKKTIGNAEDRKLIMNRWNVEFKNKAAPDYFQSFGLGFYEYFQLADDMRAEPLPILSCGMACQFNSAEVAAMDELQPYIDDALDLIEFANGGINTKWGKIRNNLGHPSPFGLKFIGVGNEQWESQYIERYRVFEKAILSKYPAIKIVSGAGPYSDGDFFNYAWKELKQLHPSLIDEHYYKPPAWFFNNASRYDNYDRNGPKVFAGEYAAHSRESNDPEGRNNWESALAEAAFMTGLERNADVVQMASYAPLLAHTDAWQWRPDLIWFDNLRTMATPNYYVQKLFSTNKGSAAVKILMDGIVVAGKDSLYASAVIDDQKKELIIKIVNIAASSQMVGIHMKGIKTAQKNAVLQELYANDLYRFNKLEELDLLAPVEKSIEIKSTEFNYNLQPYSLYVFKIPYQPE
jgi:alpha-L-arabinofuranosidase